MEAKFNKGRLRWKGDKLELVSRAELQLPHHVPLLLQFEQLEVSLRLQSTRGGGWWWTAHEVIQTYYLGNAPFEPTVHLLIPEATFFYIAGIKKDRRLDLAEEILGDGDSEENVEVLCQMRDQDYFVVTVPRVVIERNAITDLSYRQERSRVVDTISDNRDKESVIRQGHLEVVSCPTDYKLLENLHTLVFDDYLYMTRLDNRIVVFNDEQKTIQFTAWSEDHSPLVDRSCHPLYFYHPIPTDGGVD